MHNYPKVAFGFIRWKILEACVFACWIYSLESVSKMQLIFSVTLPICLANCVLNFLSGTFLLMIIMQYTGLCVLLANFSYDDCENMCTSYYHHHHHHQIGSMFQLPLFIVRAWINGMRCMSFYILICLCFVFMIQGAASFIPTDTDNPQYRSISATVFQSVFVLVFVELICHSIRWRHLTTVISSNVTPYWLFNSLFGLATSNTSNFAWVFLL